MQVFVPRMSWKQDEQTLLARSLPQHECRRGRNETYPTMLPYFLNKSASANTPWNKRKDAVDFYQRQSLESRRSCCLYQQPKQNALFFDLFIPFFEQSSAGTWNICRERRRVFSSPLSCIQESSPFLRKDAWFPKLAQALDLVLLEIPTA